MIKLWQLTQQARYFQSDIHLPATYLVVICFHMGYLQSITQYAMNSFRIINWNQFPAILLLGYFQSCRYSHSFICQTSLDI